MTDQTPTFTFILKTSEPFGPEILVLHDKGVDVREAALPALHHWHDEDYALTAKIEELEGKSLHVLVVLEGESDAVLKCESSKGRIQPST